MICWSDLLHADPPARPQLPELSMRHGANQLRHGRSSRTAALIPPNVGVTLRREVAIGKDLVAALKR